MGRSPSWGAWIEMVIGFSDVLVKTVAPPRGERGLKSFARALRLSSHRRSPSWGAWIEMGRYKTPYLFAPSRSPSWGAWIEIARRQPCGIFIVVAPPRGERGLKSDIDKDTLFMAESLPLVGSVD